MNKNQNGKSRERKEDNKMNNETKVSKYPNEAVSIVRQKTFSWAPTFVLAESKNGEDPAKVHDSRYSRVDVTLIDKDKTFVSSCIKQPALAGIIKASDYAFNKHMDALYGPKAPSTGASDKAYSMKFMSGNLKGKTVAEVALTDGEETLKNQYEFLKKNVEKFPKNKELMDAINITVKALREGKLSEADTAKAAAPFITIYEAMKGNPYKPHKENGKIFFVHDTKVHYYLGDNYPVNITIKNFYAPLIKDENGKQTIDMKGIDKDTLLEVNMKLTAEEWAYVCAQTQDALNRFSILHASAIEKDIRRALDANKNAPAAEETPKKETPKQTEKTETKKADAPAKASAKTPETVSLKLKTITPMTAMKNGTDLAVQAVTESNEEKNIIFLASDTASIESALWSKFLNKTKKAGCTFKGHFEVTEKGTLIFKGFN